MSGQAKRRATYQDVLDAPDIVVAEVIDGVLYTQPRPRILHARARARLATQLSTKFDPGDADPDGWVILFEPELHLGREPDIVVPDIAAWQRARFPIDERDPAFVTVPPDWLCEVLSPNTARDDRTRKLPVYAREGVAWVWLLDPTTRVLEAYALDHGSWRLLGSHADDAVVHAPPFEALGLEMARFWPA